MQELEQANTTLMLHFGVETEAELVSGQVSKFEMHAMVAKGKRRFYFHQLTVLNRYLDSLRKSFRSVFFSDSARDVHKMSAWYKAAKKLANEERSQRNTPMLSFPFVVSDVMERIVTDHLRS